MSEGEIMSAIIELLAAAALLLAAITQVAAAFDELRLADAALRKHHDQRYRLHYCGAYLAALANLDEALAELKARGAPDTIAGKAERYKARLTARLAEQDSGPLTKARCQALTYGGQRLALYRQNPEEPSHWPNQHFTLTGAEGVP